jgi:two-component system CheB/CheR fusion protein
MTNLLNSSEIATVFLDNNFHIKRFTPAATRVFNLIASDLGRPLAHIRSNLRFESVEQEVKEVIDRLTPRENEVQSNDGKYYVMRIIPYRTLDNFIDGAVLTFVDITSQKRLQAREEKSRQFAENIIDSVRDPMVVLDGGLRVVSMSRAFMETFQVEAGQTRGKLLYELGNGQWDIARLRNLLREVTEDSPEATSRVDDFMVEHDFPGIGFKRMKLHARHLINQHGETQDHYLLLTIEDITER